MFRLSEAVISHCAVVLRCAIDEKISACTLTLSGIFILAVINGVVSTKQLDLKEIPWEQNAVSKSFCGLDP